MPDLWTYLWFLLFSKLLTEIQLWKFLIIQFPQFWIQKKSAPAHQIFLLCNKV